LKKENKLAVDLFWKGVSRNKGKAKAIARAKGEGIERIRSKTVHTKRK